MRALIITPIVWIAAPVLGAAALTLVKAEEQKPDQMTGEFDKPLNRLLAAGMGGFALVISAALGFYRFGLIWPMLAGLVIYAAYRLALTRNLSPYYRSAIAVGLFALIATLTLLSSELLGRIE